MAESALIHRKRPLARSQVHAVVAELARAGHPSLIQAAGRLGVSPRSLQRDLRRRGLCYSDLIDTVRFEIAKALLQDTRFGVGEIAAMLGYRDPSSFSRAFRRWSRQSPRAWRRGAKWPEAPSKRVDCVTGN